MPDLTWCGTWVDTCATSWSSRSSHSATQARPSIGSAATRALVNVPPTMTGAAAKIPGSDSLSNMVRSTMQLPVSSWCTCRAPSAVAASMPVIAGHGVQSMSSSSAASSAR